MLNDIRSRYVTLDAARRDAIKTGSILNVLNAVRQVRGERILIADEVPRIVGLGKSLLDVAQNPFAPPPPAYAEYVCSTDLESLDKAPHGGSRNVFEVYDRVVAFDSYPALAQKLKEAIRAFPALGPRLSPALDAVTSRIGQEGPAFMAYSGCTVAGSPVKRAEDDRNSGHRMVTNLLKFWGITKLDIYKVCLPDVETSVYEYRAQMYLQREEHSIISVRYPLNLNSAPGGFLHDYEPNRYPPRPWPAVIRDHEHNDIRIAVAKHLRGFASWLMASRGSTMAAGSIDHQIEAASPSFTIGGRTPIVAVGKDTPREEFEGRHSELGYRQRLAGPGPQATNGALLHMHAVDPATATTETRMRILPPFTDLYLELEHIWVEGLGFLRRFLAVHRWPAIIWVESGEVAHAFAHKALAKLEIAGDPRSFFSLAAHDPTGTCGVKKAAVEMVDYVGHALIADLGEGHRALVLVNYDRGNLKYDAELAQDKWELQLAVDAAHQARVCAYLTYIATHGYPTDLQTFQRMHSEGEAAVPDEVRSDLEFLRTRVAKRQEVIISLRMRSAVARGSTIGPSSEKAKAHRSAMYAAHEKAAGSRSDRRRKVPDDPVRLAQFARLLAEQEDMDAHRLPDSHHPCRPQGLDHEQWRDWFLRLDEGVEIINAASVHGTLKIADGQQWYEEHLST